MYVNESRYYDLILVVDQVQIWAVLIIVIHSIKMNVVSTLWYMAVQSELNRVMSSRFVALTLLLQ